MDNKYGWRSDKYDNGLWIISIILSIERGIDWMD